MALESVKITNQLTSTEVVFVENLNGLAYQTGDILYRNSTVLTRLGIGSPSQVLAVNAGGTAPEWKTLSAGTGTVTSVSVVTANGISGSVATETTTPAITLTLGVITPTSVNGLTLAAQAVGFTIAGGTTSKTLTVALDASVSGTNTGDNATNSQYSGLAASKADVAQTFYIGTTQVAINRTSAALTLAGITLTTPDIGTATATAIELSHATENTLTASSGILSIEGVAIPTISSTHILTNKRITKRVTALTSSATPTVNTDNCDVVDITALAAAITDMSANLSGTPTNKQTLIYQIKDDGTARAISWGTSFVAGGVALPTTTVISKILTVGFIYNTANSLNKWMCIASAQEA